jgi:hypothetical protein
VREIFDNERLREYVLRKSRLKSVSQLSHRSPMTLDPDPRGHSYCDPQQQSLHLSNARAKKTRRRRRFCFAAFALLALAMLVTIQSVRVLAQNSPSVLTVDPASGKVGDTVTVTGTNLARATVAAVFLSDEKSDYKAVVVEQSAEKIIIKIPQVKQGGYNLSFLEGTAIFILPVRFTVE